VASSLKVRVLLSLGYGCGLRAGEVVRLKVKHIDSAQKIIRIEQSKGRKDRNVMLSPEVRMNVANIAAASWLPSASPFSTAPWALFGVNSRVMESQIATSSIAPALPCATISVKVG
jgi:site-specific recombinase XerD